jgi:hypothetical protein
VEFGGAPTESNELACRAILTQKLPPFGVHNIALVGKAAGKDVGMWFAPGAIRWVSRLDVVSSSLLARFVFRSLIGFVLYFLLVFELDLPFNSTAYSFHPLLLTFFALLHRLRVPDGPPPKTNLD